MNDDQQLKLQAFLDGELPEAEAREIANWIASDREAAALHAELKNTRQALGGFEAGIKLPESREFYWSKIEREIQRLEQTQPAERSPAPSFWLWRVLVPASAFAVVAIAAMIAFKDFGTTPARRSLELQTVLADSGAITYRDEQEGMTLVWLSYGENRLANGDAPATIQ
jgi:anti-sigma factor RsiW